MADLSPAAKAVLQASAVEACLAEWGPVNDPPCHPDDEGWNGCHLCVKRGLIAAALRAAADQVVPNPIRLPRNSYAEGAYDQRLMGRRKLLAIADELDGADG